MERSISLKTIARLGVALIIANGCAERSPDSLTTDLSDTSTEAYDDLDISSIKFAGAPKYADGRPHPIVHSAPLKNRSPDTKSDPNDVAGNSDVLTKTEQPPLTHQSTPQSNMDHSTPASQSPIGNSAFPPASNHISTTNTIFAINPIEAEISEGRLLKIGPDHKSPLVRDVFKAIELLAISYRIDSLTLDKIDLAARGVRVPKLENGVSYKDQNLPINNFTFTWEKAGEKRQVKNDRIINYTDVSKCDPAFEELLSLEILISVSDSLFDEYFVNSDLVSNQQIETSEQYSKFAKFFYRENGANPDRSIYERDYFLYYLEQAKDIILKNKQVRL
jgi:hypothetical protein